MNDEISNTIQYNTIYNYIERNISNYQRSTVANRIMIISSGCLIALFGGTSVLWRPHRSTSESHAHIHIHIIRVMSHTHTLALPPKRGATAKALVSAAPLWRHGYTRHPRAFTVEDVVILSGIWNWKWNWSAAGTHTN